MANAVVLGAAASKLFRIRKTVCKMLVKRGYEVPDEEADMTAEQFTQKFSEQPSRSSMLMVVGKRDDAEDKLMVFFPEEDLGVKECKP